MNALPLLLAAVAVLLSAGAFLLALRSGRERKDPESSAIASALHGEVAKLGERVDSIREVVLGLPSALEGLGSGLARLPAIVESRSELVKGAIEALPARIAQASGSDEVLSELRAGREAATRSVERLEAIRNGLDANATSQSSSLRDLTGSIAAWARTAEQDSSATRESASQLAAGLTAASERAEANTMAQTEALRGIASKLSDLSAIVGSAVERLDRPDSDGCAADQLEALRQANELARANGEKMDAAKASLVELVGTRDLSLEQAARSQEVTEALANEVREAIQGAVQALSADAGKTRELLQALPVRTAEEIATRPAPAPELEELAIAVRDAGALRGDSVRSIADAVSRVAERLEASAEDGRSARQDAADRLSQSLATLEAVASGVREALLPLGEALRGHGEAVVPVVQGLETAQERFEEAAVSLRVNQVEFAASVGVFTSAAQDLSTGLGAFAREGMEDASRDPAAVQQALLEALDRLLGGFSESLRATLVEADLRHREALVEIAARLPDGAKG